MFSQDGRHRPTGSSRLGLSSPRSSTLASRSTASSRSGHGGVSKTSVSRPSDHLGTAADPSGVPAIACRVAPPAHLELKVDIAPVAWWPQAAAVLPAKTFLGIGAGTDGWGITWEGAGISADLPSGWAWFVSEAFIPVCAKSTSRCGLLTPPSCCSTGDYGRLASAGWVDFDLLVRDRDDPKH